VKKGVRIRIILIGALFGVSFAAVTARAYYLQIVEQKRLQRQAQLQHQRTIPLTPQRGTIFDSRGEALALSINVDSIYLNSRHIQDPAAAASALAGALSLPLSEIRDKVDSGRSFVWLKRQVSPQESEKVRALKLRGVGVVEESRRFYPNSSTGAQVLGFTGLDPKGLEGVELLYDKEILGQAGYLVYGVDARGRGMGAGVVVQGGAQGDSLYLTLDKNLQYIAEKELAAGVQAARGKTGSVVIVEPATGRILAMASYPSFNPNAFRDFSPATYRNRSICDNYEPGSTLKAFVLSAAFEEKVVHPGQIIDCEKGHYRVGGRTIHDTHAYSKIPVEDVLKVSSNIAAAKIGKSLDKEKLYRYLSGFGFGARTGIDLPGEVSGVLRPPSTWYELDLAAISFGQGMTTTPLQTAMATAALANNGLLMKPYVVEKVVDAEGTVVKRQRPHPVRQVVSREVAAQIRSLLERTSEEGGTAVKAVVPGFVVAGKTGTSQKVDAVTGGYSADKRVASYVGMVPSTAPRLVILVLIDEPETSPYGGVVAAPVFSRIASQSLSYLHVLPTEKETAAPLPEVQPEATAFEAAQPVGGGQSDPGSPALRKMPDLRGMSIRQVLCWMEENKLDLSVRGYGRVVDQFPGPGETIQYRKPNWVRLAPLQ
jgi:cell division protein FtsI (penicillin-binding protein 3)